jgi:hypothetical protein
MTLRRRDLGTVVLGLILAGLLAHICVLPHHGPAGEIESHAAHGHTDTVPARDGGGEDALHGASCEGLPASSAAALVPPSAQSAQTATVSLPATEVNRVAAIPAPQPSGSPPLYLTHRALLI